MNSISFQCVGDNIGMAKLLIAHGADLAAESDTIYLYPRATPFQAAVRGKS